MQVGDKVRFLNQQGEGIISRILGNNQVMVTVDGDFDIPFDVKVLVPIAKEEKVVFGGVKTESAAQRASKIVGQATAQKAELGVYLCISPKGDNKLEIVLANNTDYDLPYTFGYQKSGEYEGHDQGVIEARSIKRYNTYERSELNRWPLFVIQLLYHKHGKSKLREPFKRVIEVTPDHLLATKKLHLLPLPAYIIQLDDVLMVKPDAKTLNDNIVSKQQALAKSTPTKQIITVPDEVDLHIEKLVSNPNLMNADQILKLQLDTFEGALSKAIAARLPKITFIHGVGGFVLKKFILLKLKDHRQVKGYHDAPAAKYGNGATVVELG